MKQYFYKSVQLKLIYVFLTAGGAMFALLPVWWLSVLNRIDEHIDYRVYLMSIVSEAMAFVWFKNCFHWYLRTRPLAVDDGGISSYRSGRRWQFIEWPKVEKIEKIRIYDTFYREYRCEYTVISGDTKIRFVSWMRDLPELLPVLNRYIKKHQIPVYFIDRGSDTLASAVNDPSIDRATAKKIAREGRRTEVTQL